MWARIFSVSSWTPTKPSHSFSIGLVLILVAGVKDGLWKYYNTKENLQPISSFFYWAKETDEGSPRDGYLEKIIKACEDNDFPVSYIQELKTWQK